MEVHGCVLDWKADPEAEGGASVRTVTKIKGPDGPIAKKDQKSVGPFGSIYAATLYARDWTDPNNPPPKTIPEPVNPRKMKVDEPAPTEEEKSPPHDPPGDADKKNDDGEPSDDKKTE